MLNRGLTRSHLHPGSMLCLPVLSKRGSYGVTHRKRWWTAPALASEYRRRWYASWKRFFMDGLGEVPGASRCALGVSQLWFTDKQLSSSCSPGRVCLMPLCGLCSFVPSLRGGVTPADSATLLISFLEPLPCVFLGSFCFWSFLVLCSLSSYTAGHGLGQAFLKITQTKAKTAKEFDPIPQEWLYDTTIVLKYVLEIRNNSAGIIELIVEPPFLQFVFYPAWKAVIYST